MLNAASTFGRIAPNFLADHVGPLNMLHIEKEVVEAQEANEHGNGEGSKGRLL
jgi:hypothetical protein